jgi:MFS family permease
MVPDDLVQNSVTLNSALMTTSRVFGPALAGLLVVTTGYAWCFTIDAVSYIAVIAALMRMRRSELYPAPPTTRGKGQVRAGLRYAHAQSDLWVPLVMMTIVGTLTFNFTVVIPLFVEHTLHGTDGTYTLVYSVLSVGSVIGALFAASRRSVEVRHLAIASALFGVAMILFAAAPNIGLAFPAAVLVGLTSVTFMTTSTAIVQLRSDPSMRGRVLALQAIVLIGSTPIGGPLMGALCDDFGARAGILVGAVAAFFAAGWGIVAVRRRASEPAVIAEGALEASG